MGSRTKSWKARVVGVCCVMAVASIHAQPASAYHFTGAEWPDPSHLYIQVTYVYDVKNANSWVNALNSWNNQGTPAHFYRTAPTGFPIKVTDVKDGSVSWDGISYWSPGTGSTRYANGYLNSYYTGPYGVATTAAVALHELGHIIGLAHQVGCPIMVDNTPARITCGTYSVTLDDKNGVIVLYR